MGVGISVVSMVGIAVVGKTIAVSVVSQTIDISAIVSISSGGSISRPLAVVSVVGIGMSIAVVSMVAITVMGKSIAVSVMSQTVAIGAIVGISSGISLSLRGGVHSGKKAESSNGSGLHVYLFVCKLE